MWQIDRGKEACGTRGGLVSGNITVVTTNGEKSAEVIVLRENTNLGRTEL